MTPETQKEIEEKMKVMPYEMCLAYFRGLLRTMEHQQIFIESQQRQIKDLSRLQEHRLDELLK